VLHEFDFLFKKKLLMDSNPSPLWRLFT